MLNHQLSSRYHLKPFGSGSVRFEYQMPEQTKDRNTIDFNQMISVKDEDVMNKRIAFLNTIQSHKDKASQHQNAVFSSTQDRFRASTMDDKTYKVPKHVRQQYGLDTTHHMTTSSFGRNTFMNEIR